MQRMEPSRSQRPTTVDKGCRSNRMVCLLDPFPLNRKKDKLLYFGSLNFHMAVPQAPLAERLRPQTLDQLVGQQHLTGKGSILRTAIEHGKPPSMILWGPPGTGKTTIAGIIANTLHVPFYTLSAISAGVKEVREVIAESKGKQKAILFIDEIHRFNKG